MQTRIHKNRWFPLILTVLLGILLAGTATAAEFTDDEIYRLAEGEVIEDDLYVTGSEVFIDGTVKGDVIAAGSRVEVNGTVEGDLIAAGAEVMLNGEVQDDVRVAGAGITINGTVGDDLVAAGGGGNPFPMPGVNKEVIQGVYLHDEATISGDVAIFGGEGSIDSAIGGDLHAFMGTLTLAGVIDGNAELGGDTIQVVDTATVGGNLTYKSDKPVEIPEGVASNVEYIQPDPTDAEESSNPVSAVLGWLWRTMLILVGFIILGALILRFGPKMLTRPANSINEQPVKTGLSGLLATLLFFFIPLASLLLVVLMIIFAGWFPGLVLGIFLFSTLAMIWFLSPLVTGMWLGQRLGPVLGRERNSMVALLAGVVLIVLLTRIPVIGMIVSLLSFIFAMGGLLMANRTNPPQQPQATTSPA